MLKEVTVSLVVKKETNKDGIAYEFKNGPKAGTKFTRVSIKTEETGEDFYACNAEAGRPALNLEKGQKVLLDLTEENGFKNFKFPNKGQVEVWNQLMGK